jgi:hypothetical protein
MVRPKLLKVERGIFQDPSSKNYIIRYWSNGKQLERKCPRIGVLIERVGCGSIGAKEKGSEFAAMM